ncbi:hypothetical protein Tco_0482657, partial [Tanacetum coccineum]
ADYQRHVQLTKALELLKGLQTQMAELQRQLGPAKGPRHSLMHQGRLVAVPRFGYVVAMLCIDLLYRSFVLFSYPI